MKELDWAALRLEFITAPDKPMLRDFAVTHGIPYGTLKNKSSAEKWVTARDQHWGKVTLKAEEKVADMQAAVVANDTAQRLTEIRRMQETALRFAGGGDEQVFYEKPGEAVAAYDRLEKLARLLVGEATENIAVSDARGFARDLLAIVREEVADRDVLERIATRAAALSVGSRPAAATPQPLN